MGYFADYLLGIITSQIPRPANVSDAACKCCHHKTPRWKVLLDWLTFFAAISAVGAAIWYACITHDMWKDANRNFIADQRAWVGLDDPVIAKSIDYSQKQIELSTKISNFSKTPAKQIVISFALVLAADAARAQRSICESNARASNGQLMSNNNTPFRNSSFSI